MFFPMIPIGYSLGITGTKFFFFPLTSALHWLMLLGVGHSWNKLPYALPQAGAYFRNGLLQGASPYSSFQGKLVVKIHSKQCDKYALLFSHLRQKLHAELPTSLHKQKAVVTNPVYRIGNQGKCCVACWSEFQFMVWRSGRISPELSWLQHDHIRELNVIIHSCNVCTSTHTQHINACNKFSLLVRQPIRVHWYHIAMIIDWANPWDDLLITNCYFQQQGSVFRQIEIPHAEMSICVA
jgi:hypothetical protein